MIRYDHCEKAETAFDSTCAYCQDVIFAGQIAMHFSLKNEHAGWICMYCATLRTDRIIREKFIVEIK